MPIYFYWQQVIYQASCTPEIRNGVPCFLVTFNGRERVFLSDGNGWAVLPLKDEQGRELPFELKNRIGHAIEFYFKL